MPNHPEPEAKQPAMFFHGLRKQRRGARAGFVKGRNGVDTPLALHGLPRDCGVGQTDTLPNQEPANPLNHQL